MIASISKRIILILVVFVCVWFSFADTRLSRFWSAEWRDAWMLEKDSQDFSCKFKDNSCCKWNVCMWINGNCSEWKTPLIQWCNKKCSPIVVCKKQKIVNTQTDNIIKNQKTEEIKVNKELLRKFNIEIENESKEEIKNKVKAVKIEKINDMWIKLETLIEKIESLHYNSYKLKVYIQNLNNIKYGLNQDNLKATETKQYNNQLKNTMNSIKQELSTIKTLYKSD